MASYLSLEEAAAKLGIATDRLVELRSQGQVRGFRDGASWKFPDTEIERLADELAAGGDSGISAGSADSSEGGSDLSLGSDVNLVASEEDESDVAVVATDGETKQAPGVADAEGDDDLLEMDSADLKLDDPAITHDSDQLDLSIEPNSGSTGPITDEELKEISDSDPDALSPAENTAAKKPQKGGDELDLEDEFSRESDGASSLELMSDLDASADESEAAGKSNDDVLSELDLLGSEQEGSGLVSGDSEDLLAGGSGTGSGVDDALDDDDDLVIADDDDDLVISSAGSDVSIAGDSGINLMSPSDSGLSLESEPLDLAGSSISALDLGAELGEGSGSGGTGGSGGGSGSRKGDQDGSAVDFAEDEEFQLSPSGIGVDEDDSGSQVIEIEESEDAVAEPVEFGEGGFGDDGDDVFAAEADEAAVVDDGGMGLDAGASPVAAGRTYGGYEVPFTLLQVVTLVFIVCTLAVCGMLMTDLVRNMWAYAEPSAPVSGFTDSLINLMGWGK